MMDGNVSPTEADESDRDSVAAPTELETDLDHVSNHDG